jgi:hypothetical protein
MKNTMTKYIKPIIALTAFLLISSIAVHAQKILTYEELLSPETRKKGDIVAMEINGLDTNYVVMMSPLVIFPERKFKNKREKRRYNRMVRNVIKVYPYSQIIKQIFIETELALRQMDNERERKKYIKRKEEQLKQQFEKDIRKMTYTQGRILIRLVDRETGRTSYEIIKHFKGGLSAFFWQSIAKIFSTDLKYEYDKEGEEEWIEEIVAKIENGQL